MCRDSSITAPIIAGIESRKENLAAVSPSSFLNIPKAIVEPDLDMPGMIAIP